MKYWGSIPGSVITGWRAGTDWLEGVWKGRLHILDLQENRSVAVTVHLQKLAGKIVKLNIALIPKETLLSRQHSSSKKPDWTALFTSKDARRLRPLHHRRGHWRSKAVAGPFPVPFPLRQKLFSLTAVHHICNSLLIKARSTFKAGREPHHSPWVFVSFRRPCLAVLALPHVRPPLTPRCAQSCFEKAKYFDLKGQSELNPLAQEAQNALRQF